MRHAKTCLPLPIDVPRTRSLQLLGACFEKRPLGCRMSGLPKFAKLRRLATVGTMNISLPDELRDFVEEQVKQGYGTSSEYVRELIRRDQDRLRLRNLLLAGAVSSPAAPADGTYFKRLRNRLRAERVTGRRR